MEPLGIQPPSRDARPVDWHIRLPEPLARKIEALIGAEFMGRSEAVRSLLAAALKDRSA